MPGDGSAEPDAGSGAFMAQSFHPGHYLKAYTDQEMTAWSWIFDEPNVRGVMWEVNWADVETARGVYDFSGVHEKLEYLAEQGKFSIIEIRDRSFNTTDPSDILPSYLVTDPAFEGGYIVTKHRDGTDRGLIAKVWLPEVTDRVLRLIEAMGAELDGHPYVEVVQIGESSAGFGGDIPSDYTPEGYVEELRRQTEAGVEAFPSHIFATGANFINGGGTEGPLPGVHVDHTAEAGAGLKEPDLHTGEGTRLRTSTQRHLDEYYVGVVPRIAVGSHSSRSNNTVRSLWEMAEDPSYGYTHLCWIRPLFDDGVLDRVNETGGAVGLMVCPSVLSCGGD